MRDPTRAELLYEATTFYEVPTAEDPPLEGNVAEIGPNDPVTGVTVTSVRMTRIAGSPKEKYHFVGRFKSTGDYKRLGLVTGYNYVWRKPGFLGIGNGKFTVVPADTLRSDFEMTVLKYKKHKLSAREHTYPRVVSAVVTRSGDESPAVVELVYGLCLECPSGHCGATDVER
jgi:hypothetical protein